MQGMCRWMGRAMAATLLAWTGSSLLAQTNPPPGAPPAGASCVVSAGNRNAPLAADGSYTVFGIPGNLGAIRARATCSDGSVGQSAIGFTNPFAPTTIPLGPIVFGQLDPVPIAVTLSAPDRYLSTGETAQLSLLAVGADGTSRDVTLRSEGTTYSVSNALMATVTENGLIQIYPQFASGSSARVVASATAEGSVSSTFMFILGPRGTLRGIVLAADGVTPIAGAEVSVLRMQPMEQAGTVITGADGRFLLAGVNAGPFLISAIDPATGDRALTAARIENEGDDIQVALRMNGLGVVDVLVVNADNLPVSGSLVTYTALGAYRDTRTIATNAQGIAHFSGVAAGDFTVSTRDPATRLVGTAVAVIAPGETLPITLKLQPVGLIEGVVFDIDGTTLKTGVQVRILSRERGILTQSVTIADGAFRFDTLPISDGPYTLDAFVDGRLRARVPGVVISQPNATVTRNIVLSSVGTVSGQVKDPDGVVFAGARVTMQSLEGLRLTFDARTDASGRFVLPAVPVGDFELIAITANGRTGRAEGRVASDAQNVALDVIIANNTLAGTVYLRDDVTPAGAGVTVYLAPKSLGTRYTYEGAAGVLTTQTDANGNFGFRVETAGAYYVQAEQALERGRSEAIIVNLNPSQPLQSRLVFLAKGTVSGWVRDINGVPQSNVGVVVHSQGSFTSEREITTDAAGNYSVPGVFAGDISVRASNEVTRQSGISRGRLNTEGEAITLNVTLAASGTLSGRILERNGAVVTTPLRLTVKLNSSVFATEELANGSAYQFELVPLGDIELLAEVAATGDKGVATTRIAAANESKVVDVRLVGQGRINVSLLDAGGAPVAGARVIVAAQRPFAFSQEVLSDASGHAVFERVFAGDFSLSANKPAPVGALAGALACAPPPSQNCVLLPGQTRDITLTLTAQAIGRVRGTVFQPDGVTPVGAGRVVRMLPEPFTNAFVTTTDGEGKFAYPVVTAGTYNIDVMNFYAPQTGICPDRDRIRGRATGATVAVQDEEVIANVQLIGQGAVSGHITNASGDPMAGIEVRLTNPDPVYGLNVTCSGRSTYDTVTNAEGNYVLPDVPPGNFTIVAENTTRSLRAEDRDRVEFDGDAVVVDMMLIDSAVTMPYTFHDANGFKFDITGDGSIGSGANNIFAAAAPDNRGERLEIVRDGVAVPFTNGNGSIGRLSQGAQQVEVDDEVPAGLSVTRRIYTPRAGYFTRYLEVLQNPGTNAVTVSVRIKSHHRQSNANPRVVDSSDGDQILSVAGAVNRDRWVVIDDQQDANPFTSGSIPATAHLFDGVGGASQVGSADYALIGQTGRLTWEWRDITVAPGQTVILMHFALNQLNRYSAREGALRLAQLPPEAIDDLTTDERQAISNFVVPEQSALAPLPNLDAGVLTGRVLTGDGVTPVAGARVRFKSQHILFGRERYVYSDANGSFAYRSTLDGSANNYVIPVYGFELSAVYERSGAASALTPGAFDDGQTQTVQDLIFVGQGDVRGSVKRHNQALVADAEVRLCRLNHRIICSDQSPNPSNSDTSKADGTYAMFASTPRDYFLFANKTHPQRPFSGSGRDILGAGTVTITAGDTAVADIIMEETGSISGTVRSADGLPVVNARVELWIGANGGEGPGRGMRSDTSGRFRFFDVPLGPHQLRAVDEISGAQGQASATVQVDSETEQDIQLLGFGAIHVQVLFARGAPAGNAYVFPINRAGDFADTNGRITFQLPEGSYTIRANHPDASDISALSATAAAVIASNGQQVDVTVTLKPAGTVFGNIVRPDGTTLANGFPYSIRQIRGGALERSGSTSATGAYRRAGLPVGGYVITAYDASQDRFADAEFDVTDDGQEVEVNLVLLENRIALPATLRDANRFAFDVQHAGELAAGSGAFANAGVRLQVNGQAYAGETSARLEADRRQFVIAQPATIAGLRVSRKIYVPRGAYFARYLEVLENPSAAAITVSVRLTSRLASGDVVTTSSGDTTVNAGDQWVTLDDAVDDDILLDDGQMPALAHVFAQSGGTLPPSLVALQTVANKPELTEEWAAIEVPAGGRVTLMHFAVQQINRAGSLASAQRLLSLPPEVLTALSPEDRASIRNFQLPADGVSTIEALPSLTASVNGIAYEGDVRTPVLSARVTVQSTHPLFNRVWGKRPDPFVFCPPGTSVGSLVSLASQPPNTPNPPALGSFNLQGQLTANDSIALPQGVDVKLTAQQATPCFGYYAGHPFTRYPSRVEQVAPTVTQNVIFDTGILTGTINGAADFAVTGGRLYRSIDDPDGLFPVYVPIAADATYVYPGLPPGNYDLLLDTRHPDAVGSDGGLRGQRTGVQVSLGQITVTDVSLQPTGSVQGAVITFNGEPSVNARITLDGAAANQTYDQCASGCVPETLGKHKGKRRVVREVRSDSLGRYSFAAVPAGTYTLTVVDPISDGIKTTSISVAGGQVTVQNVTLLALGSAALTVQTAAGAPVVDAYVYLYADAQGFEEVAGRTNGIGRLTIANIPAGNYLLRVRDPRHANVAYMDRTLAGTVSTNGQVDTRTISLLAAANLAISVIDGDNGGVGVSGAQVTITDARGTRSLGNTNASGQVTAAVVPAGNYSVRAVARINNVDKEETLAGSIGVAQDGQIVAVSIDLRSALIPLPKTYYDANRMEYRIEASGASDEMPRLSISGIAFSGAATAPQQLDRRQFTIAQAAPIAGLTVTRKVHVPANGYFARYLEVLDNFTAANITVDVNVQTRANYYWHVAGTSNGDAVIDNAGAERDRWFSVSYGGSNEAWSFVGSGSVGASLLRPDLSFVQDGNAGVSVAAMSWGGVTVPAGGRVVLMHAIVKQLSGDSAAFAADRLEQLPPEILDGLAAEVPASIVNFALPAGGASVLAPLPSLLGIVGGRVLEGDSVAPVPNTYVTVRSTHPLFGREWVSYYAGSLYSAADGSYAIAGRIDDGSQTIAIPVGSDVTIAARHPGSSLQVTATASFTGGSDTVVKDLVFNAGQIAGQVSGAFQQASSAGTVVFYRGGSYVGSTSIAADGSYRMGGLIAGNYRLAVYFSVSSGTDLRVDVNDIVVTVGQTTTANIVLPPNGALAGQLRTSAGAAVPDAPVTLSNSSIALNRTVYTDASGHFLFNAVPTGAHLLSATDTRNGAQATVNATVTADTQSSQDLVLLALGTVNATVRYANGALATSISVYGTAPSFGGERYLGTTGADGRLSKLMPVGAFTLRAAHPQTGQSATTAAVLVNDGDSVDAEITLMPAARLRLTVVDAGALPWVGVRVHFIRSGESNNSRVAPSTDVAGRSLTTHLRDGRYLFSAFAADGQHVASEFIVDAANDGQIVDRTVVIAAGSSQSGTLEFWEQRSLYSVPLNNGDRLAVVTNGADSATLPAACSVRARIYRSNGQVAAEAYGQGPVDFTEGNLIGNLRDFVAPVSGMYSVQVLPYTFGCQTGGYRISALVNAVATTLLPYQGGARVIGHVYRPDGTTPVVGGRVRLRRNLAPEFHEERITDANGAFEFTNVPLQSYSLTYLPTVGDSVQLSGYLNSVGETVTQDIILGARTVVNVRVLGPGDVSLGRQVQVTLESPTFYRFGYTDENGLLTETYLGNAPLRIRARHPDFNAVVAEQTIPAADGQTIEVTLRLVPTPLSGRVLDPDGSPVGNVGVEVGSANGAESFASVTTDAQGNFAFAALSAGQDLRLRANDPRNSVLTSRLVTLAAGSNPPADIVLRGRGDLDITVQRPNGNPLPNAYLEAYYEIEPDNGVYSKTGSTDASGKVLLTDLPIGVPLTVQANYYGGVGNSSETLTLQINAHGTTVAHVFTFAMTGGSINIDVDAADQQPVAGGCYAYLQNPPEAGNNSASGDCALAMLIDGVVPGNYLMTVYGNAFYRSDIPVVVVDQDTTEVPVNLSVVRGSVHHADGVPAAYGWVNASNADGSSWNGDIDAAGNYRILDATPSALTLQAEDNTSGLRGSATGTLSSVSVALDLDITLQPSGSVAGIVRDSNLQPVPSATVYATSSGLDLQRSTYSDASGHYQLDRMALGDVGLAAVASGSFNVAAGSAALLSDGENVNLDLQFPVPGSIAGILRAADSSLAIDYCVVLSSTEEALGHASVYGTTRTDSSGHYQFDDVAPGNFSLYADDCSNGPGAAARGEVQSGQALTLDMTLGTGVRLPLTWLDALTDYTFTVQSTGSAYAYQMPNYQNALFWGAVPEWLLGGRSFRNLQHAGQSPLRREVELGPVTQSRLRVSRRVYMPAEGGYLRYIETLHNPTATPIDLPLRLSGAYGSSSAPVQQVDGTGGGRYYLQTAPGPQFSQIAGPVAYVLSGNAAGVPTQTNFATNQYEVSWGWNVSIPANATVSYLYYLVERAPGVTAAASAETQAQALMQMTQPGMFDGLSGAERAQIQNFTVPQQ